MPKKKEYSENLKISNFARFSRILDSKPNQEFGRHRDKVRGIGPGCGIDFCREEMIKNLKRK